MSVASSAGARPSPFTANLVRLPSSAQWKVQEPRRLPATSLDQYAGTYCDGAVTVAPHPMGWLRTKPGLAVTLHRPVEETALRGLFASFAEGMRIDIRSDAFAESIQVYLAGDDFRNESDHVQRREIEAAAQGLGLGDFKIYPHPLNPLGITTTFFSNVEYIVDIGAQNVLKLGPDAAAAVARWASPFPDHAVSPRVRFRVWDAEGGTLTAAKQNALARFSTQVAGDPALRRGGMPLRVLGGVAGLGIAGVAAWFGYEVWSGALPTAPTHWSDPNPVPAALLARVFLTACSALGVVVGGALVGNALQSRAPERSRVKFDPPA